MCWVFHPRLSHVNLPEMEFFMKTIGDQSPWISPKKWCWWAPLFAKVRARTPHQPHKNGRVPAHGGAFIHFYLGGLLIAKKCFYVHVARSFTSPIQCYNPQLSLLRARGKKVSSSRSRDGYHCHSSALGESHWIPASPASSRNSVSSTSPSSSNSSMAWRMSVPDERVGRRRCTVVENHAFFWGKQLSQSNSGQTHLVGKKHTFSVFYCFRESLRCKNLGLEVGEATNEVQQFLAEWTAHGFSQHASWPSCWWQTVANLPILPFLILVASSGILYFPPCAGKKQTTDT